MRCAIFIAFLSVAAGCSADGDDGRLPPWGESRDAAHEDGSPSTACTAGQQRACSCSTGGTGTQVCLSDGSAFGACTGCGVSDDWCASYIDQICASTCGRTDVGSCGNGKMVDCGGCSNPGSVCIELNHTGTDMCCTPTQESPCTQDVLCGIWPGNCGQSFDCGVCPSGQLCSPAGMCMCYRLEVYDSSYPCDAGLSVYSGTCPNECSINPSNPNLSCCP